MAQILPISSTELEERLVKLGVACCCGESYGLGDMRIHHDNTGSHNHYVKTTDLSEPKWITFECRECTIEHKLTVVVGSLAPKLI